MYKALSWMRVEILNLFHIVSLHAIHAATFNTKLREQISRRTINIIIKLNCDPFFNLRYEIIMYDISSTIIKNIQYVKKTICCLLQAYIISICVICGATCSMHLK